MIWFEFKYQTIQNQIMSTLPLLNVVHLYFGFHWVHLIRKSTCMKKRSSPITTKKKKKKMTYFQWALPVDNRSFLDEIFDGDNSLKNCALEIIFDGDCGPSKILTDKTIENCNLVCQKFFRWTRYLVLRCYVFYGHGIFFVWKYFYFFIFWQIILFEFFSNGVFHWKIFNKKFCQNI